MVEHLATTIEEEEEEEEQRYCEALSNETI
jgi:hypothetical protein